jgi:membrane fusion protein (multidrug efflux system)
MFARVNIVYERRENALQLPRNAMLDADGEQSVFVIVNGKAEQRHIRTGLTNSGMVEVLEGLKGDEQVVVVGQAGSRRARPCASSKPMRLPPYLPTPRRADGLQARRTVGDSHMKLIDFAIRRA